MVRVRLGVPPVIILTTWVILLGAVQGQRQVPLPSGISTRCITTFFNLISSPDIGVCLSSLGENIQIVNASIVVEFSPEQLDLACESSDCQRGIVTLIEACEVCNEYICTLSHCQLRYYCSSYCSLCYRTLVIAYSDSNIMACMMPLQTQ